MLRLEQENHNTVGYYNKVLVEHFDDNGLDFIDAWRLDGLLKEYRGGKLLDVGCGVSPLCLMAKSKYPESEIWGMDFAHRLIHRLQQKYPQIHYVTGDFREMKFESGSFDYVVMGEILEHSENPEQLLREGMRILKKGGTLALSTPNNETDHVIPQHIWSFTEEDIKGFLPNAICEIMGNNLVCLT